MNVDLTVLIGLVSTLLGIVVTVLKLRKDDNKEIKEKDIKFNQRTFTEEIKNINDRLIKAEESIKNAHIRIDHIKEKGGY